MIVTKRKHIEEISEALKPFSKLVILGCSECAAICQTGGSEQVKEIVEALKEDHEILATVSFDSPCDQRLARRGFKRVEKELEAADAVLSLTCGGGVQSVAEVTSKTVIAALNTHFLGTTEKLGVFRERCNQCGDCMLNSTGGYCPVTACPKGLRNGPCEAERDGKCEVEEIGDCVWAQIVSTQLSLSKKPLADYHAPLSWEQNAGPRKWIWREKEEKKS